MRVWLPPPSALRLVAAACKERERECAPVEDGALPPRQASPQHSVATEAEARIFWLGLVICPLIWTVFFFSTLFSLKLEWLVRHRLALAWLRHLRATGGTSRFRCRLPIGWKPLYRDVSHTGPFAGFPGDSLWCRQHHSQCGGSFIPPERNPVPFSPHSLLALLLILLFQ